MNRMLTVLVSVIGATSFCLAAEKPASTAGRDDKLLAAVLAMIPPAQDASKGLQLKAGDSIVAIGDSITQGGGYLRDIDAVLAQQYPTLKIPCIVNKGIAGQGAGHLVGRFERDVIANKPAVVTISIGINDCSHWIKRRQAKDAPETYKANVAKMVNQAQAAGIKVILLSPTIHKEDPQSEGNKQLPLYVAAMQEIAAEKKCQFVDLHGMFLEALAKKPADHKGKWLTYDGVHMAGRGNAIMAIGVLRSLGVTDDKIAASAVPTQPPKPAK